MAPELEFIDLLKRIDEPNQENCMELYSKNRPRFIESPASAGATHHSYIGGYMDYLIHVMQAAVRLYESESKKDDLPFSLSDALVVLFLHDLEKPFIYAEPAVTQYEFPKEKESFLRQMARVYRITLAAEHWAAILQIRNSDLQNDQKQNKLLAFCQKCIAEKRA